MKTRVPAVMTSKGQAAYYAYGTTVGFLTFKGGDMPSWESLPGIVRDGWEAAARAACDTEVGPIHDVSSVPGWSDPPIQSD